MLEVALKLMAKKRITLPKTGEYIKLRNYERKIRLPFITYADFESTLVPQNNEKKNPKESYTNKYQKHISSSYGYELVCVDDKFSKPFKDAIYNFINSMIEKSKYCSDMMKKHFNKENAMTKEENEMKLSKCWIFDNSCIDDNVN